MPLAPPNSARIAQAGGEAPRRLSTFGSDGFYDLDVAGAKRGARFEFLDPLEPTVMSKVTGFALSLDKQLWVWDLDGLVQVFDESGASLGTVDLQHTFGVFSSMATLVTPSSLWLADTTTSEMFRIDRRSLEPAHGLDLRDHFTWADAVRIQPTGRPTDRFLIAHAVHAAETDGDRASVRSAPVGEIGGYFVFRRIDGEWRLDSQALCELAHGLGDPCGIG